MFQLKLSFNDGWPDYWPLLKLNALSYKKEQKTVIENIKNTKEPSNCFITRLPSHIPLSYFDPMQFP